MINRQNIARKGQNHGSKVLVPKDTAPKKTKLRSKRMRHLDIGAHFKCSTGMRKGCQMACKPGSVSRLHDAGGDDHSSSAGCCQPPQATYPDIGAGSHQPHAACVPTWSCSGWGLPCPACYQSGGALLPHLFTLTCMRPVRRVGGLFSAALSLGSPLPGVTRHPDPVEPGLSSPTEFSVGGSGHPAI